MRHGSAEGQEGWQEVLRDSVSPSLNAKENAISGIACSQRRDAVAMEGGGTRDAQQYSCGGREVPH